MKRDGYLCICVFQLLSAPLPCQVLQDHPELCGNNTRTRTVSLGLTATVSESNGIATLHYGAGATLDLKWPILEIPQVCALPPSKLVVFGWEGWYAISIVDLSRAQVLDSLLSYDPLMSPDQRWIAYRHFSPPMGGGQS